MRRSTELYAIAVCFACMVGAATASFFALYSTLELTFFESLHPSFVTARESQREHYLHQIEQARTDQEKESVRFQLQQYEKYGTLRSTYRGGEIRTLVRSLVWLVICAAFFFVHWRFLIGSRQARPDT